MDKKKLVIIISVIVLVVILGVILFFNLAPKHEYKNRVNKICDGLNQDINNKENALLFIKIDSDLDSMYVIEKLKTNYSKNIIYEISYEEIHTECIKAILEDINLYDSIAKNPISSAVIYKKGEYAGEIGGLDSYKQLEDYLVKNEIVKKKEIKESRTVSEYEKKFEDDQYILLIMADENKRDYYTNMVKKYFSNYDYDVINLNSDIGRNVRIKIENDYGSLNEYPRIFYFSNGKLIKSGDAEDDVVIEIFKQSIEKTS